jgi:nicotinamidase/pyrazinamidase
VSHDQASSCLLVVDIQPDFLPGGALAVTGGDEILAPIAALITARQWATVVVTQDWHPSGHVSFASTHPGRLVFDTIELYGHPQTLWPDHCVQGTPGAALHPSLPTEPVSAIVRKGADPAVDSYSAVRNNWNARGGRPSTGLAGYLRDRGVEELWLAGLARDFCVLWSAQDAADTGFRTTVLWDLTRAVDPQSDDAVRDALVARNIRIVEGLGF